MRDRTVEDGFESLIKCEPLSITKAVSTPAKIISDSGSDSLLANLWSVDQAEDQQGFNTYQHFNYLA